MKSPLDTLTLFLVCLLFCCLYNVTRTHWLKMLWCGDLWHFNWLYSTIYTTHLQHNSPRVRCYPKMLNNYMRLVLHYNKIWICFRVAATYCCVKVEKDIKFSTKNIYESFYGKYFLRKMIFNELCFLTNNYMRF